MSEKAKLELMCVRESLARTIANDATDCVTLLAMTGIGIWLDSSALQWIGGILFILIVLDRSMKVSRGQRKTPQDAANWLRDEFGVTAK